MNLENHDTNWEHLFIAALAVLNRALDAHRGSTAYRQMLSECGERLRGRCLGVRLYVDKPDEPVLHAAVRFHNGLFEPISLDGPVEGPVWTVSVERLNEIVTEEDQCVREPGRLPWDWLKSWISGGKELVSNG